ncbi:arginine--tRNA ligase [Candidatus Woesearchaeota archaeon]|nr:arginine--tRNA ligase [Candidatus Woesearchaeota archaeon]
MDIFEKDIVKAIKKEVKLKEVKLIKPKPEFGDFSFPCFVLAKELKKAPNEIAKDLAGRIKSNNLIVKVQAVGPYLNFFVNKGKSSEIVLKKIIEEKDDYGSSKIGKGKKALIEHTSINPNASPHVGRSRNALIGDSLTRILKFLGYETEVHYWVNDVGKQIAMLVLGCKGKKKVTFKDLLKIYVEINKKVEKNPELEKDIFELLNKLEKGDHEIKKRFREIVDICVKGQLEIINDLGIDYDAFDYESKYLWSKELPKILKKLESTGKLFKDEDDRLVLDQEGYKLAMRTPVLVLTRADGTSLYPLRDLAYTIEKLEKGKDENIIVLGEDQKLYFDQVKAALELLGYKAPQVVHYSFVLLKTGKMSTRKGNLVLLEDFMKEAVEKAKKEIKKRHEKISEENAKKIAYGSVKYGILRVSPDKNVVFDWETALSFEGDTGPYLQYAYARICSILRKYGKKIENKADLSLLKEDSEAELIKKLNEFPNIVNNVTTHLKPHLIANYLYELSQSFSEFYHSCPVLQAEEELKKARLLLVSCVKQVLKNGLYLLGIDVLEKM